MESFEDKENLTLYGVKIHLEEEELYLPNPSTIWCMPRCNQEYNLLVPLELKNFKECAEKKDKKEYLSMVQSAIDYIQQHVCILVTSSITQKNNGYNEYDYLCGYLCLLKDNDGIFDKLIRNGLPIGADDRYSPNKIIYK